MTFNVGQRIVLGFLLIISMTIGLCWYSLDRMAAVTEINQTIAEHDADMFGQLLHIFQRQQEMRDLRDRAWALHLLNALGEDAGSIQAAINRWRGLQGETTAMLVELEKTAASYESHILGPSRAPLWLALRENAADTREILDRIAKEAEVDFAAMNQRQISELMPRLTSMDELREEFTRQIVRGQQIAQNLTLEGRDISQTVYAETRSSILIALVTVMVLAVIIVYLLRRSVVKPLRNFMQFVDKVGKGDLTQRTELTGNDEFGLLGRQLNTMVESLAEATSHMQNAVERLMVSAAEIQAESQQQSSSTSEQSAAINQIMATMEEIAQTGASITERANKVAAGAEEASSASRSGLDAAEETGRAMDLIREQAEMVAENIVALTESAQSVGEIISTVNDIAERSKLLAFNASIEAAAAGEHGQTFAVVAEEIKHLAEQAKEATVQVRALLGEMQQGINQAVMLTEEAVKRSRSGKTSSDDSLLAIRDLVSNIDTNVRTFQQIVASTNQQQIGLEQVSIAVQNIGEASGHMTSGTKELEKAANNLASLGDQLRAAAERYDV